MTAEAPASALEIFERYRPFLEDHPCPLCRSDSFQSMATREKYGFPVRAALCGGCGLLSLRPMWSQEGYALFYQEDYRRLTCAGRPAEDRVAQQQALGGWLVQTGLSGAVRLTPESQVLEIGCDQGALLGVLRGAFGCRVAGVEPNLQAAEMARGLGIPVGTGSFDGSRYEPGSFDLVVLTKTLNHIVQPVKAVDDVARILKPDGFFYLDVLDVVRASSCRKVYAQIDHPFMYGEATLKALLESRGFRIARIWRLRTRFGIEIWLLAQKVASFSVPAEGYSYNGVGRRVRWQLWVNALKGFL